MKRKLKWLFYLLYLAVASIFFLYVIFPGDAARDRLQVRADEIFPGAETTLGQTSPNLFPLGISIDSVAFSAFDRELVRLADVRISPRPSSFFSEGTAYGFQGEIHGGSIQGVFAEATEANRGTCSLDATFANLNIEKASSLTGFLPGKASGLLKGKISCRFDEDVKADLNLELSMGCLEIDNVLVGKETFEFSAGEVSASMSGGLVHLTGCDMQGKQANIFLSGRIYAGRSVEESRMELTGYIAPHPEFFEKLRKKALVGFMPQRAGPKGYSFKVAGTFDRPTFLWD